MNFKELTYQKKKNLKKLSPSLYAFFSIFKRIISESMCIDIKLKLYVCLISNNIQNLNLSK